MRIPGRLLNVLLPVLLVACERPHSSDNEPADLVMLAQAGNGFEQASPDHRLTFPDDHGSHTAYRMEWWYVTANLSDDSGNRYGIQWTLFRLALQPTGRANGDAETETQKRNGWHSDQVYMAHMALSWPDGHAGFQRYARGGDHAGIAQAGVGTSPFEAWLDDWSLRSVSPGWLPLEVTARQGRLSFRLTLDSERELVLQGQQGFSQKHPSGGGSHYYSHPFLEASGELVIAGEPIAVSGQAWLDREWSSQFLQADQAGWDWFALHLDSGDKLMLYRIRARNVGGGDYQHGLLLDSTGRKMRLEADQMEVKPVGWKSIAGRKLPLRWKVNLPEIGRRFEIAAVREDQWMDVDFPYWEGMVDVLGEDAGQRGQGYMELTGYPVDDG